MELPIVGNLTTLSNVGPWPMWPIWHSHPLDLVICWGTIRPPPHSYFSFQDYMGEKKVWEKEWESERVRGVGEGEGTSFIWIMNSKEDVTFEVLLVIFATIRKDSALEMKLTWKKAKLRWGDKILRTESRPLDSAVCAWSLLAAKPMSHDFLVTGDDKGTFPPQVSLNSL